MPIKLKNGGLRSGSKNLQEGIQKIKGFTRADLWILNAEDTENREGSKSVAFFQL